MNSPLDQNTGSDTGLKTALEAGVDEAGRGCLAGPVGVSAVILDPSLNWDFVDDSKKLTADQRSEMAQQIIAGALAYHVEMVDVATIDTINILQATLLGMKRCVESLSLIPGEVLIDGNRIPDIHLPCRAIIGGDAQVKCIGAASILAKTARDDLMIELDQRHPQYGFAQHKGYGTPEHLAALKNHGPIDEHRKSFAPVRAMIQNELPL
ncbi:MAG: ribonuclease HII [Lysobacterales bacterium]